MLALATDLGWAGRPADRVRCERLVGGAGATPMIECAYFSDRNGRIGWMRLVCSGFRPQPPSMTSSPA
jgi:hypothetical protein